MEWRDLVSSIHAGLDAAIRDLVPLDLPEDEGVEWGYDLMRLADQLHMAGVRLSWAAYLRRQEGGADAAR